jgi:hypothetical protein
MARVRSNLIIHGVSGMLGEQVVVRRLADGSTILAAYPSLPKHRKFSPAQKAQQERFRLAALYAKATQGKPEYQALAKQRHVTAFAVATTDYLTPPTVLGIDASGYHGAASQPIVVLAVDDVKVASVTVTLSQDGGAIVEKGAAVIDPQDPHRWIYTATVSAPSPSVAILADVTDLAGQTTTGTAHT